MPAIVYMQSLNVDAGNASQKVALSTSHAESTAISAPFLLLFADTACFIRAGTAPVALGTGADMYLPANIQYRCPWTDGNKISAIALTGTGNLYISPDTPGRGVS